MNSVAKEIQHVVAPVRERGLKFNPDTPEARKALSRSREGAWIEIPNKIMLWLSVNVAPVRERGLKFQRRRAEKIITRSLP